MKNAHVLLNNFKKNKEMIDIKRDQIRKKINNGVIIFLKKIIIIIKEKKTSLDHLVELLMCTCRVIVLCRFLPRLVE